MARPTSPITSWAALISAWALGLPPRLTARRHKRPNSPCWLEGPSRLRRFLSWSLIDDWLRIAADGRLTLTLHIQPGAKKTEVAGVHGAALKIRLAAPPVDGKANANAALLAFIAERLGVSKSAVMLKSGQTSRRKVVEVGVAADEAHAISQKMFCG